MILCKFGFEEVPMASTQINPIIFELVFFQPKLIPSPFNHCSHQFEL